MIYRRILVLFVACALAGTSGLYASAATVGPVTDSIGVVKIGPNEPIVIASWLVTSGPNAALGTDSQRGIEIAIADQGGKLLGHPIKLEAEDDGCSAEGGQTAAQKIASNAAVVAAIGGSCSSATVPGAPILWKAGIVDVSPSATAPKLTDPMRGPDFAGFMRTAHNDKTQGAVAARFARTVLKSLRAATVHDGSPYAQGLAAAFADNYKKAGGTITSAEAISVGDTDMRPVLTRIATGKPDLIFYPIFVAEGGLITRQAHEVTGLQKATLFGADGLFSPDFLKAAGASAKGMYWSSPDLTPETLGPTYTKGFLPKYEKKYGEKPTGAFHPHSYDAANVIFAAITKVAKNQGGTLYIGRKALRDALFATKGFKGLTGTLSCDANGDCADPHIAVYQSVNADPANFEPGKDPKKVYPKAM